MKKIILAGFLFAFVTSAFGQSLDLKNEVINAAHVSDTKRLYLVIMEYLDESIHLGVLSDYDYSDKISPDLVHSFDLYRRKSESKSLKTNKNNLLMILRLKESKEAKGMFEDHKKYLSNQLETNLDEHTEFSIDGSSSEPQSLKIINSQFELQWESLHRYILSVDDKEAFLENRRDLDILSRQGRTSTRVLTNEASKSFYQSNGRDVVILTYAPSKKVKKYFRTLKRVKKK